ncbi:MAG: hypothetical protein PHF84_03805 [bacterium]|nr:hypothetical protein [bacterium]
MRKCIILLLLSFFTLTDYTLLKAEEIADPNAKIEPLNLEWPCDKPSGFHNYAQELVFYRDRSQYYLNLAKTYYNKGYSIMKYYQINNQIFDTYERDRYRYDAANRYSDGVREEFRLAEYWFDRTLDIIAHNIEWDPGVANNQEYKDLIQNTFKNLVYVTVYNGKYWQAVAYLDEYKKFNPDEKYVDEWEARIKGNIVKIHEEYSWGFTGRYSAAYLKKEHHELLKKVIDKRYSGDAKFKDELKNRVYPDQVIIQEQAPPSASAPNK